MPIPDENYTELLSEFARDTDDNGFSDLVLNSLERRKSKRARQKKFSLYAAMFIGGVIAGRQLPLLYTTYENLKLTSSVDYLIGIPIAALTLLIFSLWIFESQEITL